MPHVSRHRIVCLRSTFYFVNLSPLPFNCTYVQLFAGRADAHYVCTESSRVGSSARAPCDQLEIRGENKCDALPWGSC